MEQSGTIVVHIPGQTNPVSAPQIGDHIPVIRRLTLTGSIFEGVALVVRLFPEEAQLWVQPPDCEHDAILLPISATWSDLNVMRYFMLAFKQRELTVGRSYMPPKRNSLRLGTLGFDVAYGCWFPKSFLPMAINPGAAH